MVKDLIGRSPVRHPGVERIQDHILAAWIEELGQILAGRVINDCRLSSLAELDEKLADQGGLAGSRVTDDQEMLPLVPASDANLLTVITF